MPENIDIKLNESGGRLFELLTVSILKKLLPDNQIEWQPEIPEMKLQPDVAIFTENRDNLLAIGLIGHETCKSAGGRKADRSIEELFEIKESYSNPILALHFIWYSPNGWTAGHIGRLEKAFDYNFVAFHSCSEIWDDLSTELSTLATQMKGKSETECNAVIAASNICDKLLTYMLPIRKIVKSRQENNPHLWESVRARYSFVPITDEAIDSDIKLSLQPLIWLPEKYVDYALEGRPVPFADDTEAFCRLGGGSKMIGKNIRISDGIVSLKDAFTKDIVKATLNKIHTAEGISFLINSLGSIDALERRVSRTQQAIHNSSFAELCLQATDSNDEDYVGRCWPLDVCTAWIKVKVESKFGLLEAQRVAIGDTLTDYLWDPIIRYMEGNFNLLTIEQVKSIAVYFEQKLKNAPRINAKELSDALLLESRKKKDLNPLTWLISETMRSNSISFVGFPDLGYSYQCPFTKMAGIGLPSGLSLFQFMTGIDGEKTIIHSLSSYSNTHKDVEYAAKARILKYRYDTDFEYNDDLHLVYVLDGKWSKRHIAMFRGAGVEVVPIYKFNSWIKDKCR